MTLPIPENGDFSSWRGMLSRRADGACGSWEFQAAGGNLGHTLFEGVSSMSAAEALEEVVLGDRGLGSYLFGPKGGAMAFLILSLIGLIGAIVAAFALTHCLRNLCCFGTTNQSKAPTRMKAVKPHARSFLLLSSILGSLFMMSGSILLFVVGSQSIIGTNRTTCSVWLQLHGHFFGTEGLRKQPELEIAWQWRGTDYLNKQLDVLNVKLAPGAQNPVYTHLLDGYNTLRGEAMTAAGQASSLVTNLMQTSQAWEYLYPNMTTTIDGEDVRPEPRAGHWKLAAPGAAYMKGVVFLTETQLTLAHGWIGIEGLLATYAGPESRLMNSAHTAVTQTKRSIGDIDAAIAELTNLWDHLSPLLVGLLHTLSSFNIILGAVGAAAAVLVLVLTVRLLGRLRKDAISKRGERRCWACLYIILTIFAGGAFLMSALNFLAATIGWDACQTIDDGLFVRGEWDLLGDDILYPREVMHTDIRLVLDTCVRTDGDGNVASSLAIDGSIAELADDVAAAKNDVLTTRDLLLDKQEKTTRAQVLALAFKDVLELPLKPREFKGGIDLPESKFFDGYANVGFDYDQNAARDGFRSVLCLIPSLHLTTKEAIGDCLENGIQSNVASMNAALDMLNDVLERAWALNTSAMAPEVIKKVCSKTNAEQGHPCSDWAGSLNEGELGMLDFDLNLAPLAEAIDRAYGDLPEVHPMNHAGMRWMHTAHQIQELEYFASRDLQNITTFYSLTPAGKQAFLCPSNAENCSFGESRMQTNADMHAKASMIVPGLLRIFQLVDDYVEDVVVPTMEALVEEANALTVGSNCQFEGTALREGAVPPLCQSAFPAYTLGSLLLGLATLVSAFLAVQTWKWYRFMEDIAAECLDSATQYQLQKLPSTLMSNRPEFATLYSGLPLAKTESDIHSHVARAEE